MATIVGRGAPTSETPGILGQEYFDKLNGALYKCIDVKHVTGSRVGEADATYEWKEQDTNDSSDTENGAQSINIPAPIVPSDLYNESVYNVEAGGGIIVDDPQNRNFMRVYTRRAKTDYQKGDTAEIYINDDLAFQQVYNGSGWDVPINTLWSKYNLSTAARPDSCPRGSERYLMYRGMQSAEVNNSGLGFDIDVTVRFVFYSRFYEKFNPSFLPDTVMQSGDKELILTSSTEGSTKQFKLTVDDTGVITATEVTE